MTHHQPTVVIADDDDVIRAIVTAKLKGRGWRVLAAADGEAALTLVAESRPAVVVLDAMMPGLDGLEVLRRMKADPELAATPVVMLTARRLESDVVGALQAGATDYLVKPFIPEELAMRVARLVAQPAAA